MFRSVLILVFLSLGLEAVDAFSLGQCVCKNDLSVCGLVVNILPDSLELYLSGGISTLSKVVAVTKDQASCNFNVARGDCMCALVDTFFYGLPGGVPSEIRPVTAESCYVAEGFGTIVGGKDVYEIAEDTLPNPSLFRSLNREDWVVDVSGVGCQPSPVCPEEPVPDSPICTAVFLGGAAITKGQLDDRCYYGVDQGSKYHEARTFCEDAGLNLVWVETAEEGQAVAEITGFAEYWVALERPLSVSCDNWMWVSADSSVDADTDVEGRFQHIGFLSCFINRAVVKRNEAGEYPLKRTTRWHKKKFVCEETVAC